VFNHIHTKEIRVARDQLAESINAAMELRKGGKTVRADGEHAAEKDDAKPTGDTGLFVKKAVEAVAVTATVAMAMANP
jgi:hypothetical protein